MNDVLPLGKQIQVERMNEHPCDQSRMMPSRIWMGMKIPSLLKISPLLEVLPQNNGWHIHIDHDCSIGTFPLEGV